MKAGYRHGTVVAEVSGHTTPLHQCSFKLRIEAEGVTTTHVVTLTAALVAYTKTVFWTALGQPEAWADRLLAGVLRQLAVEGHDTVARRLVIAIEDACNDPGVAKHVETLSAGPATASE